MDGAAGAAPPGPVGAPAVGSHPARRLHRDLRRGQRQRCRLGLQQGVGRPQRLRRRRRRGDRRAGDRGGRQRRGGDRLARAHRQRGGPGAPAGRRPADPATSTRAADRAGRGRRWLRDRASATRSWGSDRDDASARIAGRDRRRSSARVRGADARSRSCARSALRISWDPAPNAIGGVTYTVASGNEEIVSGTYARSVRVQASELGDGRHRVG